MAGGVAGGGGAVPEVPSSPPWAQEQTVLDFCSSLAYVDNDSHDCCLQMASTAPTPMQFFQDSLPSDLT